ncbi:acyl-CoA dehydrogenase family protein [Lichenicoccus roseus]|uniref:Pimeloyl-CoA dehydrogenase small subunit n=1 Tax=Lichenicoccus roseus TaxID=2683649 RepID=A0A5R9J127_9PROT|nr:acyl-CoA dehydrogenase [Lichenicoccus roseus]TLU71334.1 pimeloyl-CoA dehydrogenase small subunit [Lichenicoccus roseus]
MDFDLTDDRRMLADTLGRYLGDRYGFSERTRIAGSEEGFSRTSWQDLAGLGVIGALFGEAAGGYGGAGFDLHTVFEQLGRSLVVEPFLGTLLAGKVLEAAGGQQALLDEVIAGTRLVTAALYEAEGRYDPLHVGTRATAREGGYVLTGGKAVVPQLAAADVILLSAKLEDGLALFLLPRSAPGVTIREYGFVEGGRGGELLLQDVVLDADARIGAGHSAQELIEHAVAAGIVALASEAVGIMEFARDATLDYLRTRTQFGVPIGKFQALQHRMATVLLEIEQARSATINAAASLGGDRLSRERAVSAAKFTIGRVGTLVAEEAIQMHGGIGMTWELPLPHYAKRLTMIDHQLGDEDYHLVRYIRLGEAAGAEAA